MSSFVNSGRGYLIDTPYTPASWENYLFNEKYHMTVSQTLQGNSSTLIPEPLHRVFTRGYRHFYIKDNLGGGIWSPNVRPLNSDVESYNCLHDVAYSEITSNSNGIKSNLRVFVPEEEGVEIWTISLENCSNLTRSLSFFSLFPFENNNIMGCKCTFDKASNSFTSSVYPYHVTYEEKVEKDRHNRYVFAFSDTNVTSFDCSERRFFGGDDITTIPVAVKNGGCSNSISEGSNPVAGFEHNITLEPGEKTIINIVVGCAGNRDEITDCKSRILKTPNTITEMFNSVSDGWQDIKNQLVVKTPDDNLNIFMNYWLKKQVMAQTICHRLSPLVPIRNELQDAMGYALFNPDTAKQYMVNVLKGQESNGRIQQWHIYKDLAEGYGLADLDHGDGPVWLVLCVVDLINQIGDPNLLNEKIQYKDSGQEGTIFEHLLGAIVYLSSDNELGEHGLCLMKDGDWTDPINGIGRLGKGESTWTTMGLKYAIKLLIPFAEYLEEREEVERLNLLDNKFNEVLNNHCWDGEWYVAGFDDDGLPFGSNNDLYGKIYLNAQTWAIISDTASGDRVEKCLKAINKLDTPIGNVLVWPEYQAWDPRVGKLSIKLPGTTENGAVYCHGSLFKAFADTLLGNGNSAYETIMKTLPTNVDNPPEKNLQVPLFVPNYYFGLQDSPNFGISSQHNHTGTVTWVLWVVVEQILGIKSTIHGLKIDPQLPDNWDDCYIEKNYRGCRYRIQILNKNNLKLVTSIKVDGESLTGRVIPFDKNRTVCDIEVKIGKL